MDLLHMAGLYEQASTIKQFLALAGWTKPEFLQTGQSRNVLVEDALVGLRDFERRVASQLNEAAGLKVIQVLRLVLGHVYDHSETFLPTATSRQAVLMIHY